MLPRISVIIPCRNEARYIEDCIRSVIDNDYPRELAEFFFIDGESTDGTQDIIRKYSDLHPEIRLITNPHRVVPHALNIGISHASGDYIIRLDAHSTFPPDYFSSLVRAAEELKADNVGGVWVTDVKNKTRTSLAIREVLSHRFGVGNSLFRTGVTAVLETDTVPFGCFRRDVFDRFGKFDERLVRNQDIEFNKRITRGGGKVYLVPGVHCRYFARETLGAIGHNNFRNGLWNMLTVYYTGSTTSLSVRHFVPLLFLLSLILPPLGMLLWKPIGLVSLLSLVSYLVVVLFLSARIAIKQGLSFFHVAAAFAVLHLSYGLGSLFGIMEIAWLKLFARGAKTGGARA